MSVVTFTFSNVVLFIFLLNMMSRPVTKALLACTGCRQPLLRAVLSNAAPSTVAATLLRPMPLATPGYRTFTAYRQLLNENNINNSKIAERELRGEGEGEEIQNEAKEEPAPWFLEVEPPRHAPSQHVQALPTVPDDAPAVIGPMIKYIFEDMGLDDLSMLDLRDLDPPAALGPNLIMLFGTARSERHLHISAGRFVRWLRKHHRIDAKADGLIGPGELRTKLRRLRKKAKLMGTNTSIVPRGDHGISTGWICVNFGTESDASNESASFDESGRMSGFGAPQTGTTIVVQCLTETRRNDLDLETLWQGILKRSIAQAQKLRGESSATPEELEKLVAAKVQLPQTGSASQWQALQRASQQQRYYSTTPRRLASTTTQASSKSHESESASVIPPSLDQVQRDVLQIETAGLPLNDEVLKLLIRAIFASSPAEPSSITPRLALVDRILLSVRERGVPINFQELYVTLIESMIGSPAYGKELERSQRNIEMLLTEIGEAQTVDQHLRLMLAYAHRFDWDRFWHIFRIPPRFQNPRTEEHYDLAYRVMAATGDKKLCTEALRWVYPEMLQEEPPVLPKGRLYDSIKACIAVADPAAERLLNNPPELNKNDVISRRQLLRREFVKVLKEVEELHLQLKAEYAREQQSGQI